MRRLRALEVGFLLVGLAACSSGEDTQSGLTATTTQSDTTTRSANSDQRSAEITQSDYGEEWPFTVPQGTVKCVGASSVVFEAGGRTYAVNGTARSQTDFPDIDPIWAADPSLAGTKINIGPIIEKGLTLCPK